MEVKKYRVVCSQPKFSDELYIDIAPVNGTIHDQIFFSRMQLHKAIDGQPLSRLYGSIYLNDYNGDVAVEFPKPQARKNTPDYEGLMKRYDELKQKIIARYNKMRIAGQETTLPVCSIDRMFEMSETKNAEADAFQRRCKLKMEKVAELTQKDSYKQKHFEQAFPQTFQEEQLLHKKEELSAVRERRVEAERKRATETIPAWLRFQREYSGD
ncbi:MAG: hypothetical protein IJ677_05730 [Alphaproteobacteria bacterium]|nr:hypothetical protein [Alphaproteobacteria bacterium]